MGPELPTRVMGRRIGAFLIDLFITSGFNFALFALMKEEYDEPPASAIYAQLPFDGPTWAVTGGRAALYYAILLAVGLAWWVILPGLKGWTPGKRLTGVRVVDEAGTCPAGVGRNLIRQLMWIADAFPYLIPYVTGLIVAAAS